MKRGLFVGRFQPFHNGHLEAVRRILRECDELVIAVGSSQRSHERENLFTAGERVEMAHESLKEAGLAGRCVIVTIPDINNNALWVSHLSVLAPKYDVVYSNNALVKRLFKEAGKRVRSLELIDRTQLDGTYIRRLMLRGGKWERFVPKAVAALARKIRAVERLREVSGSDKV